MNKLKTLAWDALFTHNDYDKQEHVEIIKQNLNNVREMVKNTTFIKLEDGEKIQNIYNINNLRLKVGQWVDVQDLTQQWLEAQVLDLRNERAYIQYFGMSTSWNEWININSSRIAGFRTYTTQSPYNKFYSPCPNTKPETDLIFTDTTNFDNLDNFDCLKKVDFQTQLSELHDHYQFYIYK